MERIVEKTLLYDYYGELLTDHQREIYEEVVFNDMSLSEAAAEYGISRQGVHDMIRRCDQAMEAYEGKLHLLHQGESIRRRLALLLKKLEETGMDEASRTELIDMTQKIMQEMD
ncbi:MAG: DNA-binding protein [Lachnospiraceae bacterium]|nr:DNA-binding protein [Lachnospiraceae bacterium]